jgi:hypothetical protein
MAATTTGESEKPKSEQVRNPAVGEVPRRILHALARTGPFMKIAKKAQPGKPTSFGLEAAQRCWNAGELSERPAACRST